MLIDTPNPDDRVPSCREKSVQGGVELQRIDTIPIVFLDLISDDIGHLGQIMQELITHLCPSVGPLTIHH